MSAQQERVSFPMRVLFTLFVLDVGAVALLIRHRAQPIAAPTAGQLVEMSLVIAGAALLSVLVWMWWQPLRRLLRPRATAGGVAKLRGPAQ